MKNVKIALCTFVSLGLLACGGGGGNGGSQGIGDNGGDSGETKPSPEIPELTIQGYFEQNIGDSPYSFLLGSDRSYVFANANSQLPPEELFCESSETFESPIDYPDQQINLNCIGYGDDSAVLNISANQDSDELTVTLTHNHPTTFTVKTNDITAISKEPFSQVNGTYYPTPRNDLATSRYSHVSNSTSSGFEFINVGIYSRSWVDNQSCTTSYFFSDQPNSSAEWFQEDDHMSITLDFHYVSTTPPDPSICVNKALPLPTPSGILDVSFYLLENSNLVTIATQDDFKTATYGLKQ